jgi:hypothetical protein
MAPIVSAGVTAGASRHQDALALETPAGATPRQIVAMGGGGFLMEPENPLLDDFVLGLARGAELVPYPALIDCFRDAADFFSCDARAPDMRRYVANLHRVERDLYDVPETEIELPAWI